MNKRQLWRLVGAIGTLVCAVLFIKDPSWPTPDKLLVFLTFVFMMFSQAIEMLKRLGPFVLLLAVYESFRGLAPHLNSHVHFTMMPDADKALFFGHLPTAVLQSWLWHGHVMWYDFMFYIAYMLHFVFPLALALLIWKRRPKIYWHYITNFMIMTFAGFLTYVLYPAAPPWMASDQHIIQPIQHLSGPIWNALGIKNFPSLYNKISPNPVAAVPSLHAAYATLVSMYVITKFKSKWRFLILIHPLLIYVGTVYMGDHYVIDFIHWTLWNFDSSKVVLDEGNVPVEAIQGANSTDNSGYIGPCPPSGSGTHHYTFDLYALDDMLDLASGAKANVLKDLIQQHQVAKTQLIGTFAVQ